MNTPSSHHNHIPNQNATQKFVEILISSSLKPFKNFSGPAPSSSIGPSKTQKLSTITHDSRIKQLDPIIRLTPIITRIKRVLSAAHFSRLISRIHAVLDLRLEHLQ